MGNSNTTFHIKLMDVIIIIEVRHCFCLFGGRFRLVLYSNLLMFIQAHLVRDFTFGFNDGLFDYSKEKIAKYIICQIKYSISFICVSCKRFLVNYATTSLRKNDHGLKNKSNLVKPS